MHRKWSAPSGTRRAIAALSLISLLGVAACGSDDNSADATVAPNSAAVTTAAAAETTAAQTAATDAASETTAAEEPAGTEASGEEPEWQTFLHSLETMPLDELYNKALEEEDGRIIYWNGNSVIPADRVGAGPAFEAAYPGMSVTLFGEGSTSDMVARIKAERDAGLPPSGDLFWGSIEHATSAIDEGILADWNAPEAEAYPDNLKSSKYVVVNKTFHGIAWNTDNVSAEEAPQSFEDLLDPKWAGRIVAEPRIATQLTALATEKFGDDAKAREYAEALAAQDVTFIPRYPTLIQSLASGESDVCFNCNGFNAWELLQEDAPIEFLQTEAMGLPDAQMIFAEPLHPYGAMLMARWMLLEDGGQKVLLAGGKSPTHPNLAGQEIAPTPVTQYLLQPAAVRDVYPTWDDYSAELFDLR
jgi:iron(III) transport system substrate-binding protein